MRVIVIVASGLQPSFVGCYGNEWVFTPNLDRLAAESVVFDQHFVDQPSFAGARSCWRGGRFDLPLLDAGAQKPPIPETEDLIDLLQQAGVATHLIWDHPSRSAAPFADGWTKSHLVKPKVEAPFAQVVKLARRALRGLASRDSWMLWIDLASLAPPWSPAPEFQELYFSMEVEESADSDDDRQSEVEASSSPLAEPPLAPIDPDAIDLILRAQRTYAAVVSGCDHAIGAIVEALDAAFGVDDTALIVTADRGIPIAEHGQIGEGLPWLHQELVHVPFIMRLPGRSEAGRRIAALTQHVDLFPTIASLFRAPSSSVHGYDLLPLCRAEQTSLRPFACAGLETSVARAWAVRTRDWTLLGSHVATAESPTLRLFARPEDRFEVNDVLQHHPDLARHLEGVLRDFAGTTTEPGPAHYPKLHSEQELLT